MTLRANEQICTDCNGEGKGASAWSNYTEQTCDICDGSGLVEKLCIGCDQPVDANGYCSACEDHLTECVGDPLLKRRAA